MTNTTEYLILGAGPTGIGAALRAEDKGLDWYLAEKEDGYGGLASSFVDPQGFTWDLGGHVQFSHYKTFDKYMDEALGVDGWIEHQRESWIWIHNRFIPYPLQNNLHRFDPPHRWECVKGLIEVNEQILRGDITTPSNFDEWMRGSLGEGLAEIFMSPYNFKVWAHPLTQLDYSWIGERVSVPDLARVIRSICLNQDDVSWGPNAVFRFPKKGGTGAIWDSLGNSLPQNKVGLGKTVVAVEPKERKVRFSDGSVIQYRYLISTLPLNQLLQMTDKSEWSSQASKLKYSSTNIVGIGLQGLVPEHLESKCWMYFPEQTSPYYRVTVFSNYSPHNVPNPSEQWSLMAEVSESAHKPVDQETLIQTCIDALTNDGLIPDTSTVVSKVMRRLPQGYPTPFLGRDAVVDPILRNLEKDDIFSRGRFGAWKYEHSNQDHSFAQGYQCIDRLSSNGDQECEKTLYLGKWGDVECELEAEEAEKA